jgi:hypothetical protein
MKILIEYEASWRNSFLDGSNNEPLPKGGRKFVASIQNLNDRSHPENFIERKVTQDTVMGIMNRLIGDQRKLYQARRGDNYFFKEIEPVISFRDNHELTNEVTYIRNMTGNEDQNSFTGMIKTDDAIFCSDYSNKFWGVLALDMDGLCDFIINERQITLNQKWHPVVIINRLEELRKLKPVENNHIIDTALNILSSKFTDINSAATNGKIKILPLYCSALYLQLERLSKQYDTSSAKSPRGGITGISKNGFTPKDFYNRYTTGQKKKIWGNPYIKKEMIKGEGEVIHLMTKASGKLEINIDVDREKAVQIKDLIENAGVSSFYLGKKGLAYVTDIDTRELREQ